MYSSSNLIRLCGLANFLAGLLTALYWFFHPGLTDPAAPLGSRWMLVNTMFIILLVLNLLGLVGLYGRQSESAGTLGFLGFLIAFFSTALFIGAGTFDAYVNPVLTASAKELLDPKGPLLAGPMAALFGVTGIGFALGFVLFAIAIIRAGVLPRWAAVLLLPSAPILGLSPLMPITARMIGSVVFGIANMWLGYALWSEKPRAT
ncbi:MAG: hypothetical protein HY315_10940 [Acidobacteria bacterium]|nr:hypothetical protein [Acidobacteriota bacterium]